jgi:hypothetical protein
MISDEKAASTPLEVKALINPPKKRIRGDAITRLCKGISRNVRDNSDQLANTLFERALAGDVNCTKLLVALIEKLPPPRSRGKSAITKFLDRLEFGPQWTPEMEKAKREQDLRNPIEDEDEFEE